MAKANGQQVTEQELKALESRVEDLIRACQHLKEENRVLRSQQHALSTERASLIEKTELARTRVEAMITRLRGLEINP
ncbi:MAG: TIGR02449 family protein [bacterium]